MPEGSNSQVGGVAADLLKSYVERIERLTEDKATISTDLAQVYKQAKAQGFQNKALRDIIKERAQDQAERQELEAIKETYRRALGMFSDTPLAQAAIVRLATGN